MNECIWIAEEPNPFDETEKESEAEIPTVPEEGDETVDTTSNPSSKPDSMVICSVGQATRIHCTIMKSVIPHLQRCLTKKVTDKYNLTVDTTIFATDDEDHVYLYMWLNLLIVKSCDWKQTCFYTSWKKLNSFDMVFPKLVSLLFPKEIFINCFEHILLRKD